MPESRHRRRRGRAVQRGATGAATLSMTRPRRRKTNILYLIASVVIAVLVIAGFILGSMNFNRTSAPEGSAHEYVEGVGLKQVLMPVGPTGLNEHVPMGQTVEYSTVPPTSGDHWDTQARCAFYEDGLPDERIVHNLEHGIIVVSYNLETLGEVNDLKEAMDSIELASLWGLTRFYDQLPVGTVAAATWGVSDTMQGVDRDRLATFIETYAGNLGPERIPCAAAIAPMGR